MRTVLSLVLGCLLSAASFAHPGSGIAVDRAGNVYFLDTGSGLWKIDTRGRITRQPGQRFHWLALDEKGSFASGRLPSGSAGDIERSGSSPTLLLSSDYPILVGQDGNLYNSMSGIAGLRMMRRTPAGASSVLANLPSKATRQWINGIAAGPNGAVYYTENSVIRKITAKGVVSAIATIPKLVGSPRVPGLEAELGPYLRGLAVDSRGYIYVAASGDGRVLLVTPGGKTTTMYQAQGPWSPTAVALHGSVLYVLEYLHAEGDDRRVWLPRVRKIEAGGKSTIIATVAQMPGARG